MKYLVYNRNYVILNLENEVSCIFFGISCYNTYHLYRFVGVDYLDTLNITGLVNGHILMMHIGLTENNRVLTNNWEIKSSLLDEKCVAANLAWPLEEIYKYWGRCTYSI